MKKLTLLTIALICFAACTDEDPTLDNTRWRKETRNGDRTVIYNLGIGRGHGELTVNDRVTGIYNDNLRYEVMSYTFTDDTHGKMRFKVLNSGNPNPGYRYGDTSTHDFELRAKGTKLSLGNPYGYAVLELQ